MKPKPGSLRMHIKWLKLKLAGLGKRKAQIANIKNGNHWKFYRIK